MARGKLLDEKESEEAEITFKHWINFKTDEGFTAIHFAAFRGNLVGMYLSIDVNIYL